ARVHELAVQPRHELGMLEHDLRHEGSGLQVAASFELEEIALGADDRSPFQPVQQPQSCRLDVLAHLVSLVSVVSGKTYRGSAAVCRQGLSPERGESGLELLSPGAVVEEHDLVAGPQVLNDLLG